MGDQEKQEILKELQELVDELKTSPQYKQYVEQRKLHLIDSKFLKLDQLLNVGILK